MASIDLRVSAGRPTRTRAKPSATWREILARAVSDPSELCRRLGLPERLASEPGNLPVRVPETYLGRIRRGDPTDPLLLQVLPTPEESVTSPEFAPDPLRESAALRGSCLLAKYASRSLIVATGPCGVHCRFCFRRHFRPVYSTQTEGPFDEAIRRLAAVPSVHEVILSGGDPLGLDDHRLGELIGRLSGVAHLRRVRVHTRFPIAIPQRVTPELIEALRSTRLAAIVAVHVNHPAEIDQAVADALGRLVDAGVPVLAQTVLLRRVNDLVETLAELFERLVDLRVMPYYLHQLDRVAGAAHFEVPAAVGIELIRQLRVRLPGHAVPRYVQEVPGEAAKRVLA